MTCTERGRKKIEAVKAMARHAADILDLCDEYLHRETASDPACVCEDCAAVRKNEAAVRDEPPAELWVNRHPSGSLGGAYGTRAAAVANAWPTQAETIHFREVFS